MISMLLTSVINKRAVYAVWPAFVLECEQIEAAINTNSLFTSHCMFSGWGKGRGPWLITVSVFKDNQCNLHLDAKCSLGGTVTDCKEGAQSVSVQLIKGQPSHSGKPSSFTASLRDIFHSFRITDCILLLLPSVLPSRLWSDAAASYPPSITRLDRAKCQRRDAAQWAWPATSALAPPGGGYVSNSILSATHRPMSETPVDDVTQGVRKWTGRLFSRFILKIWTSSLH